MYDPESTWEHSDIAIALQADGKVIVPLKYPVIDLTKVVRHSPGGTELEEFVVDASAGENLYSNTWLASANSGFLSGDGIMATGIRGHARRQELSVGDELKIGHSILRNDEVVLIEEDQVAVADDVLLVPPKFLTRVAGYDDAPARLPGTRSRSGMG